MAPPPPDPTPPILPPAPHRPLRARMAMWLYCAAWHALLPVLVLYLLHRARKDPDWRLHWSERLGAAPEVPGAVWVHAVSLGEMRAAIPLVRALLERGERVVTTHLTPAGRREAQRAFGPEIARGTLRPAYVPLETGWAMRRFLRRVRPKMALVIEQEIWPVMIAEAQRAGMPLYLANSQITHTGYRRALDLQRRIGWHPVAGVAGVLAKSAPHAANFTALGVQRVATCGELRFDQPVPAAMVQAAAHLRSEAATGLAARRIVTFASVVAGEEEAYLEVIEGIRAAARQAAQPMPLVVFVPRAIERFETAAAALAARGLQVLRRSEVLSADLGAKDATQFAGADVLLGDSMGEMFFYLGLSDAVVTGGGFLPAGAHNVIEPLLLGKPVLVGPSIWTIEFPALEAAAAGVLTVCESPNAMARVLWQSLADPASRAAHATRAEAFLHGYGGVTARILAQIESWATQPEAAQTP